MPTNWAVVPICLPTIVRRCHGCASDRFHANGKFRVNANHKLLDAWLLALCADCGDTTKLTVFERTKVRAVRPELLDRLHHNDIGLAAELLQDPGVRRRNRIALDWANAWRLDTGTPRVEAVDGLDGLDGARSPESLPVEVMVRFAARIPVRPVRLIAEGLGIPRGEVERLVAQEGLVSAVRLDGKRSDDFAFTLKQIGSSRTGTDPERARTVAPR